MFCRYWVLPTLAWLALSRWEAWTMLGRAARLRAARKANRWPAGGRGSRVRPHSGLGPDPQLPATPPRHTGLTGKTVHWSESRGIREGGEFREREAGQKRSGL